MSEFLPAVEAVLLHEGGYSNHPHDPGGETRYGISQRSHPDVDIRTLTREGAVEIYRTKYWEPLGIARIEPQVIATKVFVLAVNMPPKSAIRCLQRAIRAAGGPVLPDLGNLGPKTLAACRSVNPYALLAALRSEGAAYYRSLRKPAFEEGWLNRAYS